MRNIYRTQAQTSGYTINIEVGIRNGNWMSEFDDIQLGVSGRSKGEQIDFRINVTQYHSFCVGKTKNVLYHRLKSINSNLYCISRFTYPYHKTHILGFLN